MFYRIHWKRLLWLSKTNRNSLQMIGLSLTKDANFLALNLLLNLVKDRFSFIEVYRYTLSLHTKCLLYNQRNIKTCIALFKEPSMHPSFGWTEIILISGNFRSKHKKLVLFINVSENCVSHMFMQLLCTYMYLSK